MLYDGVKTVAERLDVGTAIVHLGGVRFPVSGPLRYTLTGAEAVELCALLKPATVIPVHYEGWKHFREGRAAAERAFAEAAGPRHLARDRARGHDRGLSRPAFATWTNAGGRSLDKRPMASVRPPERLPRSLPRRPTRRPPK